MQWSVLYLNSFARHDCAFYCAFALALPLLFVKVFAFKFDIGKAVLCLHSWVLSKVETKRSKTSYLAIYRKTSQTVFTT